MRFLSFSIILIAWSAFAADRTVQLTISAGPIDRENSPVSVPVTLPDEFQRGAAVALISADGTVLPGQITLSSSIGKSGVVAAGEFHGQLHFILPKLAAGKMATFTATISPPGEQQREAPTSFKWVDTSKPKGESDDYAEQSRELHYGDRPVLRYMHSQLDEANQKSRSATFKPYHHVYDPQGKRFVTKGPGGLFPHHRGVFYGFNRISYGADGKQQADVWHCNNGEYQEHVKTLVEEAGPVLGRHATLINWRGRDGKVFASEVRELTAYNTPGGVMIEFASGLHSEGPDPVKLDGDPQHAGFQFRAAQDVPDKTKDKTYYLRPGGKGEPGQFRNWPEFKNHVNLPWHALSFVLDDQRYTCAYLDRPDNPKESRFSERDYGRFGSYFEYTLRSDRSLHVNYRLWLQAGELSLEQVQRLDDDFVEGFKVEVK